MTEKYFGSATFKGKNNDYYRSCTDMSLGKMLTKLLIKKNPKGSPIREGMNKGSNTYKVSYEFRKSIPELFQSDIFIGVGFLRKNLSKLLCSEFEIEDVLLADFLDQVEEIKDELGVVRGYKDLGVEISSVQGEGVQEKILGEIQYTRKSHGIKEVKSVKDAAGEFGELISRLLIDKKPDSALPYKKKNGKRAYCGWKIDGGVDCGSHFQKISYKFRKNLPEFLKQDAFIGTDSTRNLFTKLLCTESSVEHLNLSTILSTRVAEVNDSEENLKMYTDRFPNV